MTWEEARDLDRAHTVAILPVGAVEAHGPHLPLHTDVLIAETMAREGASRIARGPWSAVLLPTLAYTPAPFGKDFPGKAGGARAYIGWPAEASAEEGRATIETLGETLAEAVREALEPKRAA